MARKQRSLNQVKEDISVRVLREKLPREWVVHSYGADYGIDCVVEFFDFIDEDKNIAETLGENFFVQLKSSDCIEYATRKAYGRGNVAKGALIEDKDDCVEIPVAKFQLDMSDILTIQSIGIAIPVLLVLIDTNSERAFFLCLNDYIDKVLIPEDPSYASKGSKTIYIPTANEILDTEDALVALRAYGKRSKMYGAFALFNYQLKEIFRMQGKIASPHFIPLAQATEMIKTFVDISLRQDIWTGHEFWKPVLWSHSELLTLKEKLSRGVKPEDHEQFLIYCSDYIWHRLTNLSNMYEELVREWFMPTYLATLTSYPPKESEEVNS
ncbi:DUF4365 domain-containing protein [Pseudomonas syringae]|uniref:DUF4365 domain-containing protein n=1 Tax=Pseudomonas syringae TaxID=317 RepID=A0A6B2AQL9_PSESX|nr:DUF4365 domain-containing protein [Pseudomonas syringae]MDC6488373.1 DUF4365 domain-containing protein [Pseudomonas syringae]MDC6498248.1 DUF4365 domain-containing protein [Pseudomonas syringae]MDC6508445.1 DUF4365 domain-containing protein [Pseudomonas syringae]MDC6529966.1 DUF4365 domain-containing protein [Pseudomonas syringae]MDC6551389.1 DUF4365 domain-containing protein [Pseudomonas syringae]